MVQETAAEAAAGKARAGSWRIAARNIDSTGNLVSGLDLSEIGEDGHAVANLLWKISAHLRARAGGDVTR